MKGVGISRNWTITHFLTLRIGLGAVIVPVGVRLTLKGWFVWFFYYVTMTFWASLFGTALEPGFLCLPDSPFFKCVFHLPWSKYDTCSSRHCICILRRKKRKDGWTVCLPFRSFLRSFPQCFCFSFHVVYLLLVSPDLLLPFSILLCALADWPVQTASMHPLPSGFQGKLQPRVLCEASRDTGSRWEWQRRVRLNNYFLSSSPLVH